MSRLTAAGVSWSPRRLGRSVPIYRPLWLARGLSAGLIFLAAWLAFSLAWRKIDPKVERLEPAEAERLVKSRLAKVKADPWTPGPPLPDTDAPTLLPSPAPALAQGRHPNDRPLSGRAAELVVAARADMAQGDPQAAATRFLRAARSQATWETLYGAGISLLEAGDPGRARIRLKQADEKLALYEDNGARSPRHYSTRIATYYAAGLAALAARDCLGGISRLRLAVRNLSRYVDVEGALVYDRKLPFRVRESGVDNHAVWDSLGRAYASCDGSFPSDYPSSYGPQGFAGEYRSADLEEIEEGPFRQGLTACVAAGRQPESHCWAWSNLNKVLWASRSHLPDGSGGEPSGGLDGVLVGSLARLLYNAAWLAGTSEHEQDRRGAGRWLTFAARLDRRAEVEDLAQRIADLGRYLGPLTGDYSALAEPWRRTDLSDVTLEADRPPEELKGIGWALSEGWLAELASRRPEQMIGAVEPQIRRAGPFGESLQTWKREIQQVMQEELAKEIDVHRKNDNLAAALAIRDFRADWLGDEWSERSARAWRSPQMLALWSGLFALWALFSAAVWSAYHLVVFPYLVYTADGYRLEHQLRYAQRKAAGKPFTREEIERL